MNKNYYDKVNKIIIYMRNMMLDIEYDKLKRKLKLAIFNEFYIESIYIEHLMLCKMIGKLCLNLRMKCNEKNLEENLNNLIDNVEQDDFIKKHFPLEDYIKIKEWNKFFNLIKLLNFNNLINELEVKNCAQTGNQIVMCFENNLILLEKYKKAKY